MHRNPVIISFRKQHAIHAIIIRKNVGVNDEPQEILPFLNVAGNVTVFVRSDNGKKRRFAKIFEKPLRKYDRGWAHVLEKTNNGAARRDVYRTVNIMAPLGAILLRACVQST